MVLAVMEKWGCECGCGRNWDDESEGQEEMGALFFNVYRVHKHRFE
jgi:hypothetical protein